jgi:serine/threonine-protein kinase
MAAVYAVRRQHASGFDKLLALKVMLPHLATDERFTGMFMDEARIASQIQHSNVVQVFDVGDNEGLPFLVMEFLRGRSLSAVLRAGGLSRPMLYWILANAAEGLYAAHRAKGPDGSPLSIVHRDVSPQNIHVGYDGQVKVVDFGIAAARGRITATKTGELKGKMAYLSPEQITQPRSVDHRADLWAFGVMLWEVSTGQKLFRGDNDGRTVYNVLNKKVERLSSIAADVSEEVSDLVASCLERQAHLRPLDAGHVARALRAAAVAEGGCDAAAVAAYMSETFAAAKATEEERIAAALRSGPPGPLTEEESSGRVKMILADDEATTEVDSPPGARIQAGSKLALGAVLATGLLVAGLWAAGWLPLGRDGRDADPPSVPQPETEAVVESVVAAEPPPAPTAMAQEPEPAPEPVPEAAAELEQEPAPRSRRAARRSRRRRPRMEASDTMETPPGVSETGLLNSPYGMM